MVGVGLRRLGATNSATGEGATATATAAADAADTGTPQRDIVCDAARARYPRA